MATLERRREIGLDLRHETDAVIDQRAVELQQRRARLDLGDGGGAGVDAADAGSARAAVKSLQFLNEISGEISIRGSLSLVMRACSRSRRVANSARTIAA